MKLKRLFLPALLSLPILAMGRPAYPGVMTVTNADGTTMEVRSFGDENFNYYTDVSGLKIVEFCSDGMWRQATRNGRLLTPVERDINVLRAERIKVTPTASQAIHKMAPLDNYGQSSYPTVSDEPVHALVILLEFSDTPFSMEDPVKQFTRMLNEEGYSDYGGCGSARDYYLASSNGKFNVVFDVSRVVKLKHNSAWYNGIDMDPTYRQARFGIAIQEALSALDDEIDFSKYDLDNDTFIDNIFFFYSGFGQADTGDNRYIWPHQGSYWNYSQGHYGYKDLYPVLKVDGVEMRTYACANELNGAPPVGSVQPYLDGIGGFCHEYGHVLGLPDLYDTQKSGTITPGSYTIMDRGSYSNYSTCPPKFSSYEQFVCRWIDPIVMEEGKMYTLPSMSDTDNPQCYLLKVKKVSAPANPKYYNEWYFFETRTKDGWDTYQPDFGLMVWHVNYEMKNCWQFNTVNSTGIPYVQLMQSSPSRKSVVWPGPDNAIFTYPGADNAFAVHNNNNPAFSIYLTDISFDAEKKESTFAWNRMKEAPEDVTLLHANPSLAVDPSTISGNVREFVLEWDEVPNATAYMVTVTRTDSKGTERIVDGLNETNVGNVTRLLVGNMTESAWKQDFKAYVRVINGLPSSKTSNVITFRAEELTYHSGVADVAADADFIVTSGNGYINAPEGAKVYNLAGLETGSQNLPAGIYVVRFGQSVKKVLVY